MEQCATVNDHDPERCIKCGGALKGRDPEPYRVQLVDIPPIEPIVRKHRFHALRCECCGTATRVWDEGIINGSQYGERVVAHVGVLSGQYRQSQTLPLVETASYLSSRPASHS